MARYMYDRTLLPGCIFIVRQTGNSYEHWSEVEMHWVPDNTCMSVFTGMDDDFRPVAEAEALSMIDKFRIHAKSCPGNVPKNVLGPSNS